MIPFAIIGFGGGVTPVPYAIKKLTKAGNDEGQLWALMTNGDLYVAGSAACTGLGKDGSGNNIQPDGWTLTNTGVIDVYPAQSRGAMVKKGPGQYEFCYAGAGGPWQWPVVDASLQNSWNPMPASAMTVDGKNVYDEAVKVEGIYLVQADGSVYQMRSETPTLAFPEKVKDIYARGTGPSVRVDLDGTIKYTGINGNAAVVSTSAAQNTNYTWATVGTPGVVYERAKAVNGQIRDPNSAGALQVAAIVAQTADGKWWGSGSLSMLGASSSDSAGPSLQPLDSIPVGCELYVSQMVSQYIPGINWRRGLQSFIVDKQAGIYKSAGTQGGAYSLFRNLATSSSSTVYTDVDQAILDDGGIDYVVEGFGDQFTALVTNGGHIFWCGRGYTGTQWPVPFRVASAYNGRLDDEKLLPPE
ncbi:hypothetical protein OMEGA_33 [Klebsiella phage vB_KaeM_KaOmega]|nr:hypothetical protein OMEGA_33 [Klebsiella phage vB_KaeM_KaOmega]